MDATCAIQASIHVFSLVRKYVSRILGTYQIVKISGVLFYAAFSVLYCKMLLQLCTIYGNIKTA